MVSLEALSNRYFGNKISDFMMKLQIHRGIVVKAVQQIAIHGKIMMPEMLEFQLEFPKHVVCKSIAKIALVFERVWSGGRQ